MSRRATYLAVSLVSGVLALGSGAATAQENCFADWSAAADIVRQEGLVRVEQLTPLAREHFKGEIVKVALCAEGGSYVYRLVVRGAGGVLKTVTVDAKKPF